MYIKARGGDETNVAVQVDWEQRVEADCGRGRALTEQDSRQGYIEAIGG